MEKIAMYSEVSPRRFVAQKLLNALVLNNMTIAFAEGCSGGELNTAVTIPGSVRAFHMGIVPYGRASKIDLGVPEETIMEYGEYSPQVALSMTDIARTYRNDSLIISTVGELTSSSPYCHVVYSFGKNNTVAETLNFLPDSKKNIKDKLTGKILSHAFLLVNGNTIDTSDAYSKINYGLVQNPDDDVATNSVVSLLKQKGLRLSMMESCTGGEIAHRITNIVGSSKVLDTAFIAYDENVKRSFGVLPSSMYEGGVYSKQVAFEMAKAALLRTGSDIAIGTTGIMETMDLRPFHKGNPGSIYIAIIMKGQRPIVEALNMRPTLTTTREQLKEMIVNEVFLLLTEMLMSQKESRDTDYLNNLYIHP